MAELNELTINGSNYTFEDDVARGLATTEASRAQAVEQSLQTAINNKVDKVTGKGLSTNDYTNDEKAKLAGLNNYDDTQVRQLIAQTNANFANYYTKAESYSATEVDTLLRTQRQGQFVPVNTLPTPSADTMFKIYLVPSTNPETQNVKDEFVTLENNGTYSWEQMGSTAVDLSGYSTTVEMNAAIANALASYYTKSEIDTALGTKQNIINDLSDIRSGAQAGSTAVQPSTLNSVVKNTVAESGVYDVSANNDNTKFESLSALLGSANLNTLIPTDIRKGGMSIKFVQSSDNKYAQARLMANSFTADVTQWQSVDTKPIVRSKNLIESAAVYKLQKTSAGLGHAESDADLLISDEDGNCIAAFEGGHIKTKNFDSSDIDVDVDVDVDVVSASQEFGDFNLTDEAMNSLLRLYNGHIRTKYFDSKSICNIINNNITYLSTVISQYENKVAHCAVLEFDDFGNWYSAYYADNVTTHETSTNLTTKTILAYGNLAAQIEITHIEVIGANQTIGNFTQGARAPYDPNFKIFGNIGRYYFNGYVDNKVVIAYRNFAINTKEFENNVYIAQLKYSVSGNEKTVDFTTTNLYTMLSELGISATFYNDLVLSSRFVYYNNYWYVTLSGAFCIDLKPVILRTQDGITFEYVTYCSGFTGGSVESSLEIIDGNIIVSQRNTSNCQIGKYGFNGNVIVSPKVISTNTSKTALVYFNGKLTCAYSVYPNIVTEWGTVARSRLRLAEINTTTLVIKNYTDITNDAGIHYPFLNKYKGSLYMVFSEDRKKLNINETRSNISLTKLIN